VSSLRPSIFDTNLASGLAWLAQQFMQRTGTRCTLVLPSAELDFGERPLTALFRIAQEALVNVARHAGATDVEVLLTLRKGGVQLAVRDNGRGFDPYAVDPDSFGIVAMKEQAAAAGGECTISTAVDCGTTVVARIPLTVVPT
jgi:signal transduction histidine kinase